MTSTITPQFPPSEASFIQPVLLKNIAWQTYEAILKDLAEQAGYKITYDRGLLEIMPPLDLHEESKKLLGRFVEIISEELDTKDNKGNTTHEAISRLGKKPDKKC